MTKTRIYSLMSTDVGIKFKYMYIDYTRELNKLEVLAVELTLISYEIAI